ncbi:hypothetical protein ACFQJD_16345 [Haloplanus sp. GCM10025708]|uniref:hypothetical protein n=1 Tax=Haloferacaceae TaxID=1644056 RepID=UPI00361EE3F3
MDSERTEARGRRATRSAVDVAAADGNAAGRDPFGDARVGVGDDRLRPASPAWRAGVRRTLDEVATRLTGGR